MTYPEDYTNLVTATETRREPFQDHLATLDPELCELSGEEHEYDEDCSLQKKNTTMSKRRRPILILGSFVRSLKKTRRVTDMWPLKKHATVFAQGRSRSVKKNDDPTCESQNSLKANSAEDPFKTPPTTPSLRSSKRTESPDSTDTTQRRSRKTQIAWWKSQMKAAQILGMEAKEAIAKSSKL
jgi:hypothetical protein